MSLLPWYMGQTAPPLQITIKTDTGYEDITGLVAENFTLVIRNTGTSTDAYGTGTFTLVTSYPALVTYAFSPADVATAGSYQLIFRATFGTGLKIYDPVDFVLTAI